MAKSVLWVIEEQLVFRGWVPFVRCGEIAVYPTRQEARDICAILNSTFPCNERGKVRFRVRAYVRREDF